MSKKHAANPGHRGVPSAMQKVRRPEVPIPEPAKPLGWIASAWLWARYRIKGKA